MIITINDADFNAVTEAWNEGFSDYLIPIKMDEPALLHRINSLNLSTSLSAVFKKDNKFVGIILLGIKNLNGKKTMWVGGMAVVPNYRRNKVADKLMQYAKEKAIEENCDDIRLEVIATNTKAIRLYESLEFKIINELTVGELVNILPINNSTITFKNENPTALISLEKNYTPWQNRLIFSTNAIYIYDDQQKIGFISYKETSEIITIQQLILLVKPSKNLITKIISSLHNHFLKRIKLNNFDMSSIEYQELSRLSYEQSLTQYQMIFKVTNNKQ